MLTDLACLFYNEVLPDKGKIEKIILSSHNLKDGLYIKVNSNKDIKSAQTMFVNRKSEEKDFDSNLFRWFQLRDYYSTMLFDTANKALDQSRGKTSKKIHSNNYLSIFLKADLFPSIGKNKMPMDVFIKCINNYMDIASVPHIKWKDCYLGIRDKENSTLIKKLLNEQYKALLDYSKEEERVKDVEDNRRFLLNNTDELIAIISSFDLNSGYIKIFFDEELDIYKKEYELYSLPRIFNQNIFNTVSQEKVVGASPINVVLNSKKPFLKLLTKKGDIPFRVSLEEAQTFKLIFDWLMGNERNYFHVPYDGDFRDDEDIGKSQPRHGYMFYLNKRNKVIEDFDNIPLFENKLEFYFKNYLQLKNKKGEIIPNKFIDEPWKIESLIGYYFFNDKNILKGYFKNTEPTIKPNTFTPSMQSLFFISKEAIYDFTRKGIDVSFKNCIDNISKRLILEQINYILEGIQTGKLAFALNFRISLLEYFGLGGDKVGSIIKENINNIRLKLESSTSIESDEEFYFLAGQITYYLLSQSEKNNKSFGLLQPFIHAKSVTVFKSRIKNLFWAYKHNILLNYEIFNNAFSMLMLYEPKKPLIKEMEDLFLAGAMTDNVFYQKSKKYKKIREENSNDND